MRNKQTTIGQLKKQLEAFDENLPVRALLCPTWKGSAMTAFIQKVEDDGDEALIYVQIQKQHLKFLNQ